MHGLEGVSGDACRGGGRVQWLGEGKKKKKRARALGAERDPPGFWACPMATLMPATVTPAEDTTGTDTIEGFVRVTWAVCAAGPVVGIRASSESHTQVSSAIV